MNIFVKVKPNAQKNEIKIVDSKHYLISVKEPPEKGKANKELIEKLQEMLKTEIKIVSGKTTSSKRILIENYSKQKLLETLKNH